MDRITIDFACLFSLKKLNKQQSYLLEYCPRRPAQKCIKNKLARHIILVVVIYLRRGRVCRDKDIAS